MNSKRLIRTCLALFLILVFLMAGSAAASFSAQRSIALTPPVSVILSAAVPPVLPSQNAVGIDTPEDPIPFRQDRPDTVINVSSVDEFLAAIGSDRVICLADGEYNLANASAYGQSVESDCWYWEEGFDGFQLHIFGTQNLHILGNGADRCSILAEPRYANVISFSSCGSLELSGLKAGHTPDQGYCSGGVLGFEGCSDITISSCDLYGCGTVGISASNSSNLTSVGTTIHDCTYGAMEAYSCSNVVFTGGKILSCGINRDPDMSDGWTGFNLIHASDSDFFAIVNSEICGNVVQTVFRSERTTGFYVLGCDIRENTVGVSEDGTDAWGTPYRYRAGSMFNIQGKSLFLEDSSFSDNIVNVDFFSTEGVSAGSPVVDLAGNPLGQSDIEKMQFMLYPMEELNLLAQTRPYAGDDILSGAASSGTDLSTLREVHVTTADEFLAAIGSHTVIHVDTELLDLSTASDYGGSGSNFYYWADNYDGPGLVITGVSGLVITGMGKDRTTLLATPRYADVLYFDSCHDVRIADLTAGHRKEEPGSCSGDVFEFICCEQVSIFNCGLFGCGVNAIVADRCSDFSIYSVEMYECSWSAAELYTCSNIRFDYCSIRDCGNNSINLADSSHIVWNGAELANGSNFM